MTTDTIAPIRAEGARHEQRLTEYQKSDVVHAASGEAAIADLRDVDFNNLTGQLEFITNEEARARFGPFWDPSGCVTSRAPLEKLVRSSITEPVSERTEQRG